MITTPTLLPASSNPIENAGKQLHHCVVRGRGGAHVQEKVVVFGAIVGGDGSICGVCSVDGRVHTYVVMMMTWWW